ncbi:MAG TPA: 2Fe-2S iron-sulfur cluster binding domain-containing protein [Acidocella sp.]|nr:MAG: hypothetical protein B7Z77_01450 [Acidocella sp. 20-58-15]HQT38029.1 2Fe-2S iron-sulfur cluster binding domain-containing protein [Acidocella sp.]
MLVTLHVSIDGETSVLTVPPGQTLLKSIELAGLNPPCACRQGTCGACMAKLLAGTVDMPDCPVLSRRDRADGMILPCQALATSDVLHLSYDE